MEEERQREGQGANGRERGGADWGGALCSIFSFFLQKKITSFGGEHGVSIIEGWSGEGGLWVPFSQVSFDTSVGLFLTLVQGSGEGGLWVPFSPVPFSPVPFSPYTYAYIHTGLPMCMYDNRNTVFTLMKLAHAYMYDNRNTVFTLMKLAHAYMYIHT